MAFFDVAQSRSFGFATGWAVVSAPFRMIGRGMIALAEASDRMEKIKRLHETTDAQLAAAGTTRADEVKRIFGAAGAV